MGVSYPVHVVYSIYDYTMPYCICIIVTTDVQGVVFTRVLEEGTYSIQCSYLSGSDVSGCFYVLVSREVEVENVTGFIERDSNGVTLEVANIGCYSEVLAYDDIIINGIFSVRTSINHSEACLITGKAINTYIL